MLSLVKMSRVLNATPPHNLLRDDTCNMVSPATQVNTPRLNPSQTNRYSIYLLQRDGRLRWLLWSRTYRDGLSAYRWSAIQVLTGQRTVGSWTHNLLISRATS